MKTEKNRQNTDSVFSLFFMKNRILFLVILLCFYSKMLKNRNLFFMKNRILFLVILTHHFLGAPCFKYCQPLPTLASPFGGRGSPSHLSVHGSPPWPLTQPPPVPTFILAIYGTYPFWPFRHPYVSHKHCILVRNFCIQSCWRPLSSPKRAFAGNTLGPWPLRRLPRLRLRRSLLQLQ